MSHLGNVCVFVLCVTTVVYGRAARNSVWTNCSPANGPVTVTNMDISPKPLTIPGDLYFTIQGYSNETLGSSRLILRLTKMGSWFNIPIPCIRNIGSCTYEDMCTLLEDMIRENWLGISRGIGRDIKSMLIRNGLSPGLCPQPPQSISVIRNIVNVPQMPSVLYWFAEGTYKANIRVLDNTSGRLLVCSDVRVDVIQGRTDAQCDGWFGCFF